MQLNQLINSQKKDFNEFYKRLLNKNLPKNVLSKAMVYGSMNGGKRIRPFLVSVFSKIYKVRKIQSLQLSAAIESIHSYSLIHDDLPSMDNDDYRRGKLSTHKKFDEATAILAGDALHDLAFEILSDNKTHFNSNIRINLINKLSICLGVKGLAGGQSLDLLFENTKIEFSKIISMYEMKTGELFSFSCLAPCIIANKNKDLNFAIKYGKLFGLLFQITDDILDEKKDFKNLGKTPGKDKKQGKSTIISIKNISDIKKFCIYEVQKFENKHLKIFKKNPILSELLKFNIEKLD
tara:strand:- start:162 stop:1040 length:879 start_codon:yes stop_codon:yes gene_type:complete